MGPKRNDEYLELILQRKWPGLKSKVGRVFQAMRLAGTESLMGPKVDTVGR